MTTQHRITRHFVTRAAKRAGCVATLVLLAACAGPEVPLDVAVETKPLDLTFGRQDAAEPGDPVLDRPSGTGLEGTTFPGFITPPVPVSRTPADGSNDLGPQPSPVPCPAPPRGARAANPAGADVEQAPLVGTYRFRRSGFIRRSAASYQDALEATPEALSDVVERTVANVVSRPTNTGPEIQYDLTQTEVGLTTTTTFTIRPGDGVFLSRVVTQREGLPSSTGSPPDTESFLPRPMIRILNLPLSVEAGPGSTTDPDQSGAGVDPLSGIAMDVAFHTTGRTLVDGCGEVFEGWVISVDSGTFRRPRVRTFAFNGELVFAPQLGGLVIVDDITLHQGVNEYEGEYFYQQSRTTLDDDQPAPSEDSE